MNKAHAINPTVALSHTSDDPVVFTPADFDRFVMTQREAVSVANDHLSAKAQLHQIGEELSLMIFRLHDWCKHHPVAFCVMAPRLEDVMVVVVASDEDANGSLHDAMSALDLEMFSRNRLRVNWLLLRASEAAGLDAFVNRSLARTIYRAHDQAA